MDGRPFMRCGPRLPNRPILRGGYPLRGRGLPPVMEGMRPGHPRMFADGVPRGVNMMRPGHPIPFMNRGGLHGMRPRGPPVMLHRPSLMPPMSMTPRGPRPAIPRQMVPRAPNMMSHDIGEIDCDEFDDDSDMMNGMNQSQGKGRGGESFRAGFQGQNRGGGNQRGYKGPIIKNDNIADNQQNRGSSNRNISGAGDASSSGEITTSEMNQKKFVKKGLKTLKKRSRGGNTQQKSVPSQQQQQQSSGQQSQSQPQHQPTSQQSQQQLPKSQSQQQQPQQPSQQPFRQQQQSSQNRQNQSNQQQQPKLKPASGNTSRPLNNNRGRGNSAVVSNRPVVGRGTSNSRGGGVVRPPLMPMIGRGALPPLSGPPAVAGPFQAIQPNAYGGAPMIGPPTAIPPAAAAAAAAVVAVKRGPPMMNTSVQLNKRVRYDHPAQTATNGYQQFQTPPAPVQQQPPPAQLQPQPQPQQSVYSLYETVAPQQEFYTPTQTNAGPPVSQVYGVVNTYTPQFPATSTYPTVTSQYGTNVSYSTASPSYTTGYTTTNVGYDVNMGYSQSIAAQQTVPNQQSVDCYGYPKTVPAVTPGTDAYGYSTAPTYTPAAPVYEDYASTTYVDPNTYTTSVQDPTYGQGYATYTY